MEEATVLAALIGAVVAGLISSLVNWLTLRTTRRQQLHDENGRRWSEFLAGTHAVTLMLGRVALAPAEDKERLAGEGYRDFADRVNTPLNTIMILDSDVVVQAAFDLDRHLVELTRQAKRRVWTIEEWRHLRDKLLAPALEGFVQAGRKQLRRTHLKRATVESLARGRASASVLDATISSFSEGTTHDHPRSTD